jgi:hypothetical protein
MGHQLCKDCVNKNKEIGREQKKLSKGMKKITIKIVGTKPLIVNRFQCRFTHLLNM